MYFSFIPSYRQSTTWSGNAKKYPTMRDIKAM